MDAAIDIIRAVVWPVVALVGLTYLYSFAINAPIFRR